MEEDKNNNENINNERIMGCGDSKDGGGFQAKRSIAERRGFSSNAAKINTSLVRTITTTPTSPTLNPLGSSSCFSLAACGSQCLTIPPGISPTELLDYSPIMLPNSQALPSPTTGTFFQLPLFSASLNQVSSNCNTVKGRNSESQHLQVQASVSTDFPKRNDFDAYFYNNDANVNANNNNNAEMLMSHSEEASDENESMQPKNNVINGDDIEQHQVMEEDQKETSYETEIVRSSEDGYNWRKYGQKQVKGCEYPRSYYKCTQPNCLVKKKVERSHDGQITEIIYNGSHNHIKPHNNIHRASSSLSNDEILEMGEANESGVKVDDGFVWRNVQPRIRNNAQQGLDWKGDFQERASSDSTGTQISDPVSTSKGKSLSMLESEDTPEFSSRLASHDGNEDGTSQALVSLEDDAEHIESQSKRRKKESNMVESNLPPRAVREPRVVIQIETEVDILDDGYRWRKYGQKVVKGNPNPRSYYKCTSSGCPVRKHVERASHNIKYVLTTYEGKHNHGVPTARNSNHFRSSDGRLPPSGCSNGQVPLSLTRNNGTIPNPETQIQTLAPHFDRKPETSNDFFRSNNLVGSFNSDMKFAPSSMYQMKYSSLNNTMPYGSYALNNHDHRSAPQSGSLSSSVFPDFSMPSNLPSSSGNFPLNGMNYNHSVKQMGPMHQSFNSGQHLKEIDSGFMRPKQEHKDDMMYNNNTCLPTTVDNANASLPSSSASPSIYQRAMQNFPS